jgi:drug/metabolite transporter (DMT)-like permease
MITRRLASYDPPLVTSAISAGFGAMLYSTAAPFLWIAPTLRDWVLMAVMRTIAAASHFLIIAAHRMATRLALYDYTEIPSAILFGFLIFGDWPKSVVWIGIGLIVASGIAATWREAKGVHSS